MKKAPCISARCLYYDSLIKIVGKQFECHLLLLSILQTGQKATIPQKPHLLEIGLQTHLPAPVELASQINPRRKVHLSQAHALLHSQGRTQSRLFLLPAELLKKSFQIYCPLAFLTLRLLIPPFSTVTNVPSSFVMTTSSSLI